tara:strand:- start:270 stop:719 length:450 start_codon:yes stop_codon:yes gene_type:complete
MNLKNNVLESVNNLYNFFYNENNILKEKNSELENNLKYIQSKLNKLETEFKNYKDVSLVKKLDKDLFEKNNEIIFLKKKIENLNKKIEKSIFSEKKNREEEEIEVTEITINNKEYYISTDIHKNVYKKLKNKEVGKYIGKYINNRLIRC